MMIFTKDFQPFSVGDDCGFRSFVQTLNPPYSLLNYKVPVAYESCQTIVMNKMRDVVQVCITTDCWSSSTNDSYLGLTVHFLNNAFVFESVLLDCLPIEESTIVNI